MYSRDNFSQHFLLCERFVYKDTAKKIQNIVKKYPVKSDKMMNGLVSMCFFTQLIELDTVYVLLTNSPSNFYCVKADNANLSSD